MEIITLTSRSSTKPSMNVVVHVISMPDELSQASSTPAMLRQAETDSTLHNHKPS